MSRVELPELARLPDPHTIGLNRRNVITMSNLLASKFPKILKGFWHRFNSPGPHANIYFASKGIHVKRYRRHIVVNFASFLEGCDPRRGAPPGPSCLYSPSRRALAEDGKQLFRSWRPRAGARSPRRIDLFQIPKRRALTSLFPLLAAVAISLRAMVK